MNNHPHETQVNLNGKNTSNTERNYHAEHSRDILCSVTKFFSKCKGCLTVKRILIISSLLFIVISLRADRPFTGDTVSYGKYNMYDSDKLLEMADKFASDPHKSDSALVCLSVVANRYYEDSTDKNKISAALIAMSHLGQLYMGRYYDYPEAYRNFMTAKQICEETDSKENLPKIYLGLSILWQLSRLSSGDNPNKIEELLKAAVDTAAEINDEETLIIAVINICSQRQYDNDWGPFLSQIDQFKSYRFTSSHPLEHYAVNLVKGMELGFKGKDEESTLYFEKARENVGHVPFSETYIMTAYRIESLANESHGSYHKALDLLKKNMSMASELSNDNYRMSTAKALSDLYEKMAMPDSAKAYHYLYLDIKDQFEEKSQVTSLKDMDFLDKIDKINTEVKDLSLKKRRQTAISFALLCIVVVVLAILATVVHFYRVLKRNHRKLYENNIQMLRLEDEHKVLCGSLLKENEELRNQLKPEKTDVYPCNAESATDIPKKYKNTSVDAEGIGRIYRRVLKVMETSDEIYSQDFSLQRLAEMVGYNYKYVSQAINEHYHNNFNQFLNEYRIREVCRRMHTPDASLLTVEALGASVGFKSRTSFSNLFKKSTGLTPTEYLRLASEEMK